MTASPRSFAPVVIRDRFVDRFDRAAAVGVAVALVALVVYWLSNRMFDATRGDFFYLADAFLHGRVWLDDRLGFQDVILRDGHIYVPFAPFPAVALMPIVAIFGPVITDQWETGINAALAASTVGLAWWFAGRAGVRSLVDRFLLVALLGFSTQIWWVTTRGGVWHTGHLIATILTLACLIELWGSRRAWLIGLLAGAAFMTRARSPSRSRSTHCCSPATRSGSRGAGRAPDLDRAGARRAPDARVLLLVQRGRFGSPFESGYGLALLPEWLEAQRQHGLFSTYHVPMNVDYLFLRLPVFSCHSPSSGRTASGCRSSSRRRAPRTRRRRPGGHRARGGCRRRHPRPDPDAPVLRRRLAPVRLPLCPRLHPVRLGAVRRGRGRAAERRNAVGLGGPAIGLGWMLLIAFGVAVGADGVYWAYHLK